jgi:hypothetical protein
MRMTIIAIGAAFIFILAFLLGSEYVYGNCSPILDTQLTGPWCRPDFCTNVNLTGVSAGCQSVCQVTISGNWITSSCPEYLRVNAELVKQCAGGPIEYPISSWVCSSGGASGSFSGITVNCTCCTPSGSGCFASLQVWLQVCGSTGTCTSGSGGIAYFLAYTCTNPCPGG